MLVPVAGWVLVRAGIAPPIRELARGVTGLAAAGFVCWLVEAGLDRSGLLGSPGSLAGATAEGAVLLLCYAGITLAINRSAVRELRLLWSPGHRTVGGAR